jgi:hypothetical protein
MSKKQHKQKWRTTRVVYRFVSGRHLSGNPASNATYLHKADEMLVKRPANKSTRWAMAPGYYRQAWRMGVVSTLAGTAYGYAVAPLATEIGGGGITLAASALGGRKAYKAIRNRQYKKKVIRPLITALSPVVGMPADDITKRIVIANSTILPIHIPLPDHFAGKVEQVKDISRIVTQRIGGEWDSSLQLKERPFYVALSPRPAPPTSVNFEMVREFCLNTTQDKPFLGLGARSDAIYLDFTGEIAHLAASIGTGGGKSAFLRFLIAQFAHHGVRDFTVCDVKWVSLQGMEDVPGLKIYRDVEDIWDAIALDRAEMDRRYVEMLANPKKKFRRKVIVMEEQNAFALESSIRWREVRPQGDKRAMPPVWNDIALLLVKARQVNMNIIGVYQRMSAEASGGGTYRDQYGLKLMSRFSPQAWDTLVGTKPRGISSAIPGRATAILGGSQRSVQLPFITVDEAMAFATSGPAVALSSSESVRDTSAGQGPDVADIRAAQKLSEAPTGLPLVTLREAVDRKLINGKYAAIAKRMERDPFRPAAKGKIGNANLYEESVLIAWGSLTREGVSS